MTIVDVESSAIEIIITHKFLKYCGHRFEKNAVRSVESYVMDAVRGFKICVKTHIFTCSNCNHRLSIETKPYMPGYLNIKSVVMTNNKISASNEILYQRYSTSYDWLKIRKNGFICGKLATFV